MLSYIEGNATPEEWEESFAAMKRLDDDAARSASASLAVMILGPDAERPNPTRRKMLAELRTQKRARLRLGVIVSPSLLVRGFMTTLDWIIPKPKEEENVVVPTFSAAVAWAEERQKRPLPTLWELFNEIEGCSAALQNLK